MTATTAALVNPLPCKLQEDIVDLNPVPTLFVTKKNDMPFEYSVKNLSAIYKPIYSHGDQVLALDLRTEGLAKLFVGEDKKLVLHYDFRDKPPVVHLQYDGSTHPTDTFRKGAETVWILFEDCLVADCLAADCLAAAAKKTTGFVNCFALPNTNLYGKWMECTAGYDVVILKSNSGHIAILSIEQNRWTIFNPSVEWIMVTFMPGDEDRVEFLGYERNTGETVCCQNISCQRGHLNEECAYSFSDANHRIDLKTWSHFSSLDYCLLASLDGKFGRVCDSGLRTTLFSEAFESSWKNLVDPSTVFIRKVDHLWSDYNTFLIYSSDDCLWIAEATQEKVSIFKFDGVYPNFTTYDIAYGHSDDITTLKIFYGQDKEDTRVCTIQFRIGGLL